MKSIENNISFNSHVVVLTEKEISLAFNEKVEFINNGLNFSFTNTLTHENESLKVTPSELELMANMYLYCKEFVSDQVGTYNTNFISSLLAIFYIYENYKKIDENLLDLFFKQNQASFTKDDFIQLMEGADQSVLYKNLNNELFISIKDVLQEFSYDIEKLKNKDFDKKFFSLLNYEYGEKKAEELYGIPGLIDKTVDFFSSQIPSTPEEIMFFKGNLILDLNIGIAKKNFIPSGSSDKIKNIVNLENISDVDPIEALKYCLFFDISNVEILNNFLKDFPLDKNPDSKIEDREGTLLFSSLIGSGMSEETLLSLATQLSNVNANNFIRVIHQDENGNFNYNNWEIEPSESFLMKAITCNQFRLAEKLIELGANVNYVIDSKDIFYNSVFKAALFNPNEKFLKLIIETGKLKINLNHFTPFIYDQRISDKNLKDLAKFIVDINNNDSEGSSGSLLMTAISNNRLELTKEFVKLGADVNYYINYEGDYNNSVLKVAVLSPNEEFFKMIIESGKLELKASTLQEYIYRMDVPDKYLKSLASVVSDINKTERGTESLLMAAIKHNRLELAEELIKLGADVNYNYLTSYGSIFSTWQQAMCTGKEEFLEMLIKNANFIIINPDETSFSNQIFQSKYYKTQELYDRISQRIEYKNDINKVKTWLNNGEIHNIENLLNAVKFFSHKVTGFDEEDEFCKKENEGVIDLIKFHIAKNWYHNNIICKNISDCNNIENENDIGPFTFMPEELVFKIGFEYAQNCISEILELQVIGQGSEPTVSIEL